MAVLTHVVYRKGIHSSGILFIFWLLLLITDIVILRSKIMQSNIEVSDLPFLALDCQFKFHDIILQR